MLRVGIVSTANIASKNFLAASAAKGVEVVAVSSRSLDKAKAWAEARGVPKAYGSHDEMLADPEIDAVYVPIPTTLRPAIVAAAAKAGKHVLAEKPIAPSAAEAVTMLEACREAGVVFMDGIMFMHNPRLDAMRAVIDSEGFGTLKRVVADFSFCGDEAFRKGNIRMDAALEPMGSLGDLGVYTTRLAMFAFNWEVPVSVSAVAHTVHEGVPVDISSVLTFPCGGTASFTNSFESAFRQYGAIVGTQQSLEIEDFVLSGVAATPLSCSFTHTKRHGLTAHDMLVDKECEEVEVHYAANQEVLMWEKFAQLCKGDTGDAEHAKQVGWWAEVSLNTQRVLDAIMASSAAGGASVKL